MQAQDTDVHDGDLDLDVWDRVCGAAVKAWAGLSDYRWDTMGLDAQTRLALEFEAS